MTNPGFPSGFHRDVNAILDAFNVGLQIGVPVIGVNELRANLRRAGMTLNEDDSLNLPPFELPVVEESDEDEAEYEVAIAAEES